MTAQEAHRKFTTTIGKLVIVACTEYDSRFVFQAVPPKYAKPELIDKTFDSLYSVEKKTGKIARFRPFDISEEEYQRGKRLSEYDKFYV